MTPPTHNLIPQDWFWTSDGINQLIWDMFNSSFPSLHHSQDWGNVLVRIVAVSNSRVILQGAEQEEAR
jgi:hypothetical protein